MLGQPGVSHQAAPVPTSSTPGLSPLGPATEPLLGHPAGCRSSTPGPCAMHHSRSPVSSCTGTGQLGSRLELRGATGYNFIGQTGHQKAHYLGEARCS